MSSDLSPEKHVSVVNAACFSISGKFLLSSSHESWGYYTVDGEEIMTLAFFVLIQYWRVMDRRTDGHIALAKTRASIASSG